MKESKVKEKLFFYLNYWKILICKLYVFHSNESFFYFLNLTKCNNILHIRMYYDITWSTTIFCLRRTATYCSTRLIRHQRRRTCVYIFLFFFFFSTTDEVHQPGSARRVHCYFTKDTTKRQYFILHFPEATSSPVKCVRVAVVRATSRGIHLYP